MRHTSYEALHLLAHKTHFFTEFVSMFMIYMHMDFALCILSSSGLLIIAIDLKGK